MHTNSCDEVQPRQMRKIKPTRRSVSGVYAFRGNSMVAYESTLERDFLIRTEFSLNVLDVIPQPAEIPFVSSNGRTYTYTPDFLVYYRLGSHSYDDYPKPVLVEVKPETEWRRHWREWLPKWKAAWSYARSQGWEFHIRDESRIRDQMFGGCLRLSATWGAQRWTTCLPVISWGSIGLRALHTFGTC